MARLLKDAPITEKDILEYLDINSDFTFEVKVLNLLNTLKCDCRHSQTYTDPITQRMREYDIRAIASKNIRNEITFNLFLAVECKNIRENFPFAVSCLPRTKEEAYEEMIFATADNNEEMFFMLNHPQDVNVPITFNNAYTVQHPLSLYGENGPVGKSCEQVGRGKSDGVVQGSDSDVYDKISQAISSSKDLVQAAACLKSSGESSVSIIKPVLVVPDNRLWRILYDGSGTLISGPEMTNYVSYFYGKTWEFSDFRRVQNYTISHLDIVTFSELPNLIASALNFDREEMISYLKELQDRREISREAYIKT